MAKKHYYLAIGAFLSIPLATMLGAALFIFINPEIAAGHPDYVRNYRLLDLAKHSSLYATMLVDVALWFLTCFFLIESKERSQWWLFLAVFGPLGFSLLAMLGDKAPTQRDLYQRFVRKLNVPVRAVYEICTFLLVWVLAFQLIEWKRDLMIMYESATTGVPAEQIIEIQNASSGMWAFSEGLQIMYLVVLIYLLWPICFSLIGRLAKSPASPAEN
jgi:hypothetical protein